MSVSKKKMKINLSDDDKKRVLLRIEIFFPGWFGGVVKFFQVSRHLTHNINIVFRTLLLVLLNSLFSIPDKIDIHCTLLL